MKIKFSSHPQTFVERFSRLQIDRIEKQKNNRMDPKATFQHPNGQQDTNPTKKRKHEGPAQSLEPQITEVQQRERANESVGEPNFGDEDFFNQDFSSILEDLTILYLVMKQQEGVSMKSLFFG